MEKIKFIADTPCDIPDKELKEYGIDMVSVPIAVDGVGFLERKSFTIHQFYDIISKSKEIPVTSRVPAEDFLNSYKLAYVSGYTDIICVTINASGSGTNASAHMAREEFYTQNPEALEKIKIHIIDSKTYSLGYGYPVIQSARMAKDGRSVAAILNYLEAFFARAVIYLGCYTLEYAKKSGRISAAASFAGDILGVRPIIKMVDGKTEIVQKVRGEKNIIPKILELSRQTMFEAHTATIVTVCGSEDKYGKELQTLIKKQCNIDAELYNVGASIVINAGPKIVAAIVLGSRRD